MFVIHFNFYQIYFQNPKLIPKFVFLFFFSIHFILVPELKTDAEVCTERYEVIVHRINNFFFHFNFVSILTEPQTDAEIR
jgi:hypothetical protein